MNQDEQLNQAIQFENEILFGNDDDPAPVSKAKAQRSGKTPSPRKRGGSPSPGSRRGRGGRGGTQTPRKRTPQKKKGAANNGNEMNQSPNGIAGMLDQFQNHQFSPQFKLHNGTNIHEQLKMHDQNQQLAYSNGYEQNGQGGKTKQNKLNVRSKSNDYRNGKIHDPLDPSYLRCQNLDTNADGLILDHKNIEKNEIYKIGRVLGSGMIGVACLCQNNIQNKLHCLKYMSIDKIREKNLFKNIKDEVQIMYELIGVTGVCQIEDIIINEDKDITIILPFYALTDLWNYMKVKPGRHLNERDSRKVFTQLVDTFMGIHERQIMHRDIKPENILVKNDELDICLSDFGLATRVGPQPKYEKTRTGQAGTPCYYSYEIVKKRPYDERVDVWCLGVLLFEMLFGALPFSHDPKDARDYTASISSLHFKFPSKSIVSQEARDLIGKILVPQDSRIALEDIKQHPWLLLDLDLIF